MKKYTKVEEKLVTVRLLESHFYCLDILMNFIETVDSDEARMAKIEYYNTVEDMEKNSASLDQSEAIYGFAAYLLNNFHDIYSSDYETVKRNMAILAGQFIHLNELSNPQPGYAKRVRMPSHGVKEDGRLGDMQ